ncbi:hypothetical protein L1987_59826 [Smallanthus sonchifolius]|uniref:Uncharacterized protein n=1 Tax=Smallanthus sonchifolius TaxID=185202 RepID=A0ACB9D6P8_9ASTR|nr:hypothetical protein L1987_59826 [Smallanthus sonchifolius]
MKRSTNQTKKHGIVQVLCTVTLGAQGDGQRLDSIVGPPTKRFMLHYSFPPYCINEVRKRTPRSWTYRKRKEIEEHSINDDDIRITNKKVFVNKGKGKQTNGELGSDSDFETPLQILVSRESLFV